MYIKKAGRKYYNQKDKFDKRYGCKSRQKPLHIEFLSGRFHSHRHRIFYSLNFLHICVIPSMFDIPEIIKIAGNIPAVDELEFYDQ